MDTATGRKPGLCYPNPVISELTVWQDHVGRWPKTQIPGLTGQMDSAAGSRNLHLSEVIPSRRCIWV